MSIVVPSETDLPVRVDIRWILDELTITLRNLLIDPNNRTTNKTETFVGDGVTTVFELTQDKDSENRHKIMNVKTLTINGVLQTQFKNFFLIYRKDYSDLLGKILFVTPPADTSSIVVNYDAFKSLVFEEWPRTDLTTKSYPRVSVQMITAPGRDRAVGGKIQSFNIPIQFTVVAATRSQVENLIMEIKNIFAFEANKHGFQLFDYISTPRIGPMLAHGEDPNELVYVRTIDYVIPNQYEFSS